jgi:hypothetical protein
VPSDLQMPLCDLNSLHIQKQAPNSPLNEVAPVQQFRFLRSHCMQHVHEARSRQTSRSHPWSAIL